MRSSITYTRSIIYMNRVTKSSRIRLAGHVECIREVKNSILVGKTEGRRPL
jgi:hypothetical protein